MIRSTRSNNVVAWGRSKIYITLTGLYEIKLIRTFKAPILDSEPPPHFKNVRKLKENKYSFKRNKWVWQRLSPKWYFVTIKNTNICCFYTYLKMFIIIFFWNIWSSILGANPVDPCWGHTLVLWLGESSRTIKTNMFSSTVLNNWNIFLL